MEWGEKSSFGRDEINESAKAEYGTIRQQHPASSGRAGSNRTQVKGERGYPRCTQCGTFATSSSCLDMTGHDGVAEW